MTIFSLNPIQSIFFFTGSIILAGILGYFLGRLYRARFVQGHRNDAIDRSKSVILGEVYEKVFPLLPDCPYAPRDMVFLGKGVDFIVFDGLSEGELRKVVFLEVKSGRHTFSKNEKMIRECIQAKKVSYSVIGRPL